MGLLQLLFLNQSDRNAEREIWQKDTCDWTQFYD